MEKAPENIAEMVQSRYSELAVKMQNNEDGGCCDTDCCQATTLEDKKTEDIQRSPFSLGCDLRLIDTAAPQSGEVVLDFGSGSGHDTRTIADLVGTTGQVIGIDFSKEMIELAKDKSSNYPNINYIRADIQEIPLEDNYADLIISNCVFNLIENKEGVFAEGYRLLKPGGRMVISDMITTDKEALITGEDYCACIGGASSIEEYVTTMRKIGYIDIETIKEYESTYKGSLDDIPYQSVLFIGYKPHKT